MEGRDIIGNALCTQNNTKPVFVSIGHRITLETATRIVLELCRDYRLPETTRAADHAVKMAMKDIQRQY